MLSVTVIRGLLIPSQLCSCCCPWPSVPNLEYWIALPFVFSGRLLDQEFSSDRSVHRSKSIQLILDSAAHRPISAGPEMPVSGLGKGLGGALIPAPICWSAASAHQSSASHKR